MTKRIGGIFAAGLVLLATAAPANAALRCTASTSTPKRFTFVVGDEPTFGFIARPATAPKALITYDHGYGDQPGDADDLRNIKLLSEKLHAIVVAPIYRGTRIIGPEETRGAPIRAGATDTVQLARTYRAACGRLPTVALGLSMGGTIAGLSAINGGRGLYDLWVGLNPMQDASTASLVAGVAAGDFGDDLDREAGGNPLSAAATYSSISLAQRHADLARSGIKGAVIIDAVGDMTGAQLQTQLLQPLLVGDGLAVDRAIAIFKDSDAPAEPGLDSALLGKNSVLTGHLGLTSVRLALERIRAFLASGTVENRLAVRDLSGRAARRR